MFLCFQEEILVRREFGTNDQATRRLAWHPQLETLLAVIDTNRIAFINVPPTEGELRHHMMGSGMDAHLCVSYMQPLPLCILAV